jgi:hypothetical protein
VHAKSDVYDIRRVDELLRTHDVGVRVRVVRLGWKKKGWLCLLASRSRCRVAGRGTKVVQGRVSRTLTISCTSVGTMRLVVFHSAIKDPKTPQSTIRRRWW